MSATSSFHFAAQLANFAADEVVSTRNELHYVNIRYEKLYNEHENLKYEHENLNEAHENLKYDHENLKYDHENLKHDHENLKKDHENLKEAMLKMRCTAYSQTEGARSA
jgi:chromosome segregation ATPase